jgi:hypothetical protein
MRPQYSVTRLLIVLLALVIVLGGNALLQAQARPLDSSVPSSSAAPCGAVSCTAFLPIVFNRYPLQPQLEVTQGVQQPDNRVPLIGNRTTFVRYTLTSMTPQANVTAWLYGTRNDAPLPGSPIAALNNPRTLKATADRAVLNDTYNFKLPSTWLSGNILLSTYATNSSTFTLTTSSQSFQFVSANPLLVTVVPIAYTCNSGGSGTTTPPGPYEYLTDYTFRVYPVPSVSMATHASVGYSGPCLNGVPKPGYTDWSNMLDSVTTVWEADGYPNRYYYGLVKIDCGGSCILGIGWVGYSKVAVGFDGIGASHSGASETHAHEVGHNHAREHAPGCGADSPDPNFPYVSGGKGYIGDITHPNYGFDINTQAIYPYSSRYDMMSYCTPEWVSDYTYEGLLAYGQLESDQPAQTGRALMISGRVEASQVVFQPAYILDLPLRLPEPGDYVIELLDASENVIAAYPFAPGTAYSDRLNGKPDQVTGFHLTLPYSEQTASVRVRRGEIMLGALRASPASVSLRTGPSVLSDNGQALSVTWSAGAPEGESLHYLVRASVDGGATWQTLGVNLTESRIELKRSEWASQHVLIQVLASTGLRTAQLDLGPYNLEP